jgi:hypothetical protein
MNKIALRQSLIAGITSGLIFSVFSFGTYYSGINSFFSFSIIYKFLPVVAIMVIIFGFNLRKRLGGFISFKEALQFALVSYLVYEIFAAIVTYLLFVVIDPQLTQKLKEAGTEFSMKILKSAGAPREEMDKTLANMKKQQETTGYKNIWLGLGTNLVLDFIISMLVAVIVKKEQPAELDYEPTV